MARRDDSAVSDETLPENPLELIGIKIAVAEAIVAHYPITADQEFFRVPLDGKISETRLRLLAAEIEENSSVPVKLEGKHLVFPACDVLDIAGEVDVIEDERSQRHSDAALAKLTETLRAADALKKSGGASGSSKDPLTPRERTLQARKEKEADAKAKRADRKR